MSRYDEIVIGLKEALAHASGDESIRATTHTVSITEVPKSFAPEEIKDIRLNAKMTQRTFASCIGVTKKAVEAWEGGRTRPDGAARRMLSLLEANPRFADEVGIITR